MILLNNVNHCFGEYLFKIISKLSHCKYRSQGPLPLNKTVARRNAGICDLLVLALFSNRHSIPVINFPLVEAVEIFHVDPEKPVSLFCILWFNTFFLFLRLSV